VLKKILVKFGEIGGLAPELAHKLRRYTSSPSKVYERPSRGKYAKVAPARSLDDDLSLSPNQGHFIAEGLATDAQVMADRTLQPWPGPGAMPPLDWFVT
jgi:hypothetical protein